MKEELRKWLGINDLEKRIERYSGQDKQTNSWENKLYDKLKKWNKEELNETLKIGHYYVIKDFIEQVIYQEKETILDRINLLKLNEPEENDFGKGYNTALRRLEEYITKQTYGNK